MKTILTLFSILLIACVSAWARLHAPVIVTQENQQKLDLPFQLHLAHTETKNSISARLLIPLTGSLEHIFDVYLVQYTGSKFRYCIPLNTSVSTNTGGNSFMTVGFDSPFRLPEETLAQWIICLSTGGDSPRYEISLGTYDVHPVGSIPPFRDNKEK